MILFLYGEDTYRLKQKLDELKEKFVAASGSDTNLALLDGEKIEFNDFHKQVFAMPFLGKTRLVIVRNLLRDGKKELLDKVVEILPKIPQSTVLVIAEEKEPDKRLAIYKQLVKLAKIQEFVPLEEEKLRAWVRKEVASSGAEIDPAALSKLIEYVGNDLWRLQNEIKKLSNYSLKITVENVETLVQPQIQANIFDLIDAIALKKSDRALKELYKLLDSGQNEIYILTMIIYQYRNMLVVKDIQERKGSNQWTIAKEAKLRPFVVQKTIYANQKYSLNQLKKIYELIGQFDTRIKTGKIEARAALELLIFRLCKSS